MADSLCRSNGRSLWARCHDACTWLGATPPVGLGVGLCVLAARAGMTHDGNGNAMLTETLCTRCGLCCDGTLLGDVELEGPREAARLEMLGLDVESDDADVELLALPCASLRGTRCSVYAERPRCCRTFECRLLQRARRGLTPPEQALACILATKAQVRRVTTLLAGLEPRARRRMPLGERVADALAARSTTPLQARRRRALEAAMTALSRRIRTTFLD